MGTNKRLLAQNPFHSRQQFFRVKGFTDVIQCAPAQGPTDGAERRLSADHNDTAIRLQPAGFRHHLETVQLWHVQIQQGQIKRLAVKLFAGLSATVGF